MGYNSLSGAIMVEGKSVEFSLREIVEDASTNKDLAPQLVSLLPQYSSNPSLISLVSYPSPPLPVQLASLDVVSSSAPSLNPPIDLLPPVCEPVSVPPSSPPYVPDNWSISTRSLFSFLVFWSLYPSPLSS